jgi:hypothetical protein
MKIQRLFWLATTTREERRGTKLWVVSGIFKYLNYSRRREARSIESCHFYFHSRQKHRAEYWENREILRDDLTPTL